jgi:branched-chain amino acid transport system substrate-binding protein
VAGELTKRGFLFDLVQIWKTEARQMKRRVLLIVAIVALVLWTGGLAFSAPFPKEIRIGIATALSGGWAGFGAKPAGGFKVAIEQINALGGIKSMGGAKLVGIIGDDEATPEKGAVQVERLINRENVVAMVGVWPTQTPTAAMSERNQTPCIDALGIAETWNRGYRWVFKNYSRGIDEAEQEFAVLAEQCKLNNVAMPKTTYMIYISDDCSTASAAGYRELCKKYGIKILGDEVVDSSFTTFGPQLDRIAAAKPDMLFACHYTPDAIVLYREIMERKLYFPYGIMSWGGGIEDVGFYTGSSPAAYSFAWAQENGDQLPWKRPYYNYINDIFKRMQGFDWTDSHVAITYGSVWQLKDALERTTYSADLPTFRKNLRDAIAKTNITMQNGEKVKIPGTNLTFVPALEPFGWQFLRYDDFGITVDKPGNMSMNLGGVRWTLYPEWSRMRDPEGPRMVKLPLPGWDVRLKNSPEIVTNLDQLAARIKQAKDPANQAVWGVWGTAANK